MKALMSKKAEKALRSGEPLYVEVVPKPMRSRPVNMWKDAIVGAVLGFLAGGLVSMILGAAIL